MKRRYSVAFDFDGTLCENKFPEIGEPKKDIIKLLEIFHENDWDIIIWTCRSNEYQEAMKKWLDAKEIPYDFINENPNTYFKNESRKIYADIYIDDKGLFTWSLDSAIKVYGFKRVFRDLKKEFIHDRDFEN
jgi:hydroxymethylpyrimidine pyrophosphatase-like HAD family hydrolase